MNLLGTKLRCEECGAQAVVIKSGDGRIHCHGRAMGVVAGDASADDAARRQRAAETTGQDADFYSGGTT